MAGCLAEDRDRIAHGLNNVVIHRLFAAGLDLQTALGLIGEHGAAAEIHHAVGELDQAITDLRNTVFGLGLCNCGTHTGDNHVAPCPVRILGPADRPEA
jgi:hypothetical protein